MRAVFDIETDGLLPDVTKIHCLCYYDIDTEEIGSITDYNGIIDFITNAETLIGHNIIKYDIPVLELLLNVKVTAKLVDTLAISWYLYPTRKKHGLESWGVDLGTEKPKVDDWKNLTVAQYVHRCKEDVAINTSLWDIQRDYLDEIYSGEYDGIIAYLGFKMECLRDQEQEGITLDFELCHKTIATLNTVVDAKLGTLSNIMPKQIEKVQPKIMYKKDGSLSSHGEKWKELLAEKGLASSSSAIYCKANPGSSTQLKSWLFSLGWKPKTFSISKATKKRIPQVSLPFGAGICDSVKALYKKYPALIELEGLYIAQHRLGVLNSFLNNERDGKIYAGAHGFTTTLRLAHAKPVVNLPGVSKPYGKEVRGCLKAAEGMMMCGSDISGLEDSTKMHYMFYFDPDYVTKMQVPGFDPHIDIGLFADLITVEEADFFASYDKDVNEAFDKVRYSEIKEKRAKAKTVNFGGVYGIGPDKLAEQLKISLSDARKLHKAYWKKNHAVKKVAKAVRTRIFGDQKWLYNPVSGFWYYLRNDKDIFSGLNQSTGVFVFDNFLRYARAHLSLLGNRVSMQIHDELLFTFKPQDERRIKEILQESIDRVNSQLKLNVTIGISIDLGDNYADCH